MGGAHSVAVHGGSRRNTGVGNTGLVAGHLDQVVYGAMVPMATAAMLAESLRISGRR